MTRLVTFSITLTALILAPTCLHAATLQSIAVTPANPSIAKGLTQQFTATGTFSDSSTQNLTNQVTWISATPAVATINSTGLATGVATGTSTISATLGGVTGSTVLTVTAAIPTSMMANAGTTPQSAPINTAFTNALAVTVTDAGGNPVSGVSVTFTAPSVGASGLFSNSTTTITVLTDLAGVASAPFTANGTVGGPYPVRAAATDLTTVDFALTNLGGPGTGQPIPTLSSWALLLLGLTLVFLARRSLGRTP